MKKYHPSVQGFTLVELLVTMAVLVILSMVAAPGLQGFMARSNMQTLQNDFTATMNRARSEAMARNTCVTVCQLSVTASGNVCETASTAIGQWHRGWMVVQNPECVAVGSGVSLPAQASDVLAVKQPGDARYQLTDGNSTKEVAFTYTARGVLQAENTTLMLTDTAPAALGEHDRALVINNQGRVLAQDISVAANPTAAGDDEAAPTSSGSGGSTTGGGTSGGGTSGGGTSGGGTSGGGTSGGGTSGGGTSGGGQ